MKKVLITGKNSYIGDCFETWMKQFPGECEIHQVSVQGQDWKNIDFSTYDVILHVAALVHKKETKEMEPLYDAINCDLAVAVAQKAKESGIKQFVFFSTAAVYGSEVPHITTTTNLHPTTFYGKSKLRAEKAIVKLSVEQFRVAIVRPPMIYGPNCKGNFPRLVKLAKLLPIFPKIENKRSMLYIDHLCEFLRLLVLQEGQGYYHPQDMKYVETSEMVGIIRASLGKNMIFTKLFNFLVQPMAKKVGSIGKLFGDCCYEEALSDEQDIARARYCMVEFKSAVQKSIR